MSGLNQVRDGLLEIDIAVHNLWDLGKNMVIGWETGDGEIRVAFAPCSRVLGHATANPRLLHGPRQMDRRTFAQACKVVQARILHLAVPFAIGNNASGGEISPGAIDSIVRRYSIVRTAYRAVMLFEIADFDRASPVQQVSQFVSLEHSISTAAELMAGVGMPVELARSTAGDGVLYLWNRHEGLQADLRAYVAFLLILSANALAHRQMGDHRGIVPRLRSGFTVGSHYSYHQVEANRPRAFEYATGQVSITLARMVTKALPGQVLLGNFERPAESESAPPLDAVFFVARAEALLARLRGAAAEDFAVEELRSLVTGGTMANAHHDILKYVVEDKHGYRHDAFNLRVKLTGNGAAAIDIGLRTPELASFDAAPVAYALPPSNPKAGGPALASVPS